MYPDYEKKATKLDSHVPGDAATPFQDKLKTFGINGRVLGPTVGAWCEVSEDFDLILDLIAHALADEETSTIQVPHHQSVARQKSKLVADFGLMMHLTWARRRGSSWTTGSSCSWRGATRAPTQTTGGTTRATTAKRRNAICTTRTCT